MPLNLHRGEGCDLPGLSGAASSALLTCGAVGLLAATSLSGCVVNPYTIAHETKQKDPVFMAAYTNCGAETAALGFIPDIGITREVHFFKCMRQAGLVMPDRWNRNPAALGYYQRVDQ